MKRLEYMRMKLSNISNKILEHYDLKLKAKATQDESIFVVIKKEMYGLPQAGLLVQELLAE